MTVGLRVSDSDGASDDDTAAVTILTPEEALEDLGDDVDDLAVLGVLSMGQAQSLTAKTAAATQQLERDHKRPALNQLMAFVNHVEALITAGILTPAEGQALIDPVNLIIDSINATC